MSIVIDDIRIKRGNKTNVDSTSLNRGEMAAALDTRELFVGDGIGKVKLSDLVIVANHSALPGTGETNKVYFVITDETQDNEPAGYIFKASNYVLISGGTANLAPSDITGFDTAIGDYITTVAGQPNGLATLDVNGNVPSNQLPDLAITDVNVVANNTERDALTAQAGDYAVVTDTGKTFIYTGNGWQEIVTSGSITSVNGQIGPAVSLDTDDIAEGSAQYFTASRAVAAVINNNDPSATDKTFSAQYITNAITNSKGYFGTKQIDESGIADGRVTTYNSTSNKIEYHKITVDGGEL